MRKAEGRSDEAFGPYPSTNKLTATHDPQSVSKKLQQHSMAQPVGLQGLQNWILGQGRFRASMPEAQVLQQGRFCDRDVLRQAVSMLLKTEGFVLR